ncbi:protein tramtrack, beta isoform [Musca vetustissima]|uniref:protein tramtrack, beta isoform n=1 Tax=Musca vetustissima TaxID=27455 RepID=UPI002AB7A3C8|nr:protein tramtrack, beta isoform [Musca vetustissima]
MPEQEQQRQQQHRQPRLTNSVHHHQQHHHSQSSLQQHHHQQNNDHQQQFCLRWHNHQTSLLSTLPILLDQSHLTDVTISAEGRTLRAHRVVLSACSSFFLEIFRTLDNTHHPVIIIPGASFQAIVSLLTFMYSGEVNVYEEQIPTLLSLAETLGIKGLADVHNNLQKSSQKPHHTGAGSVGGVGDLKDPEEREKSLTPPTPPPPSSQAGTATNNFAMPQPNPAIPLQHPASNLPPSSPFSPLLNPVLNSKFPSPLENFFLKSLQFYPNLMHQPLNFSQTALNKTSEILAKYQQQCNLYQANLAMQPKDLLPLMPPPSPNEEINRGEDLHGTKRFCTGLEKKCAVAGGQISSSSSSAMTVAQQKDMKRIDKIVENLRGSNSSTKLSNHESGSPGTPTSSHLHNQLNPLSIKTSMEQFNTAATSPLVTERKSSSLFATTSSSSPIISAAEPSPSSLTHPQLGFQISPEDQLKLQQHLDKYAASCAAAAAAAAAAASASGTNENLKQETRGGGAGVGGQGEKLSTPQSPQGKTPSSSKLYATCFICHKQLSNQYNLRVHLETHQNVRYACNVCSHVSRSKDALRKHVSYRHPGAPSPCETDARRKRANKLLASTLNAAAAAAAAATSSTNTTSTSSPNSEDLKLNLPLTPPGFPSTPSGERLNLEQIPTSPSQQQQHQQLAAQLNYQQMFLPNQFHLAAANAVVQQHLREKQKSPARLTPTPTTTPTKELGVNFPKGNSVQTMMAVNFSSNFVIKNK